MILHAAGMAMSLLETVSQAPVVLQCPQAAPEPSWKWFVQSVIPVAGGTLIAVWSFVQNRRSEQKQWERNQKATHDQWIRDQKKAEWRELLETASEIETVIPAVAKLQDRYDSVADALPGKIARLLGVRARCLFIEAFERQGNATHSSSSLETRRAQRNA